MRRWSKFYEELERDLPYDKRTAATLGVKQEKKEGKRSWWQRKEVEKKNQWWKEQLLI